MVIESGTNHLILQLARPYQEDLYNAIRMSNIDPGSQVNEADYATISGKIIAVPRTICNRRDYNGFSTDDIRVGDTAIFSYVVVHSFQESQTGDATFANEFRIGRYCYWRCELTQVFGVVRGGEILMKNGYVMVEEVKKPTIFQMPTETKVQENATLTKIIAIGSNTVGKATIDAHAGDTIAVNYKKCSPYKLNGKTFSIVKQKDILAVVKEI